MHEQHHASGGSRDGRGGVFRQRGVGWAVLLGCGAAACGGADPSSLYSERAARAGERAKATAAATPAAPAAAEAAPAACAARPGLQMPQHLSQLGCFAGGDPQVLAPEVIPFSVNAPLWLDDAEKDRWIAVLPPIGRHRIDEAGVALLTEWITEMSQCTQ